jgi:hypothetical protein
VNTCLFSLKRAAAASARLPTGADRRPPRPFDPNAAGGTDVRWTGSFTEGLRGTGPVMVVFLRGAVQLILGRLVKAAERE